MEEAAELANYLPLSFKTAKESVGAHFRKVRESPFSSAYSANPRAGGVQQARNGCKILCPYLWAGWKGFEIYCLRHSALTLLAESGCDAFTLARIAGHSSITITQRYCHPQADAIERAFVNFSGGHKIGHKAELPKSSEC